MSEANQSTIRVLIIALLFFCLVGLLVHRAADPRGSGAGRAPADPPEGKTPADPTTSRAVNLSQPISAQQPAPAVTYEVPKKFLNLRYLKCIDHISGELSDEFLDLLGLDGANSVEFQRLTEEFLDAFGKVELDHAKLVIKEDGNSTIRLFPCVDEMKPVFDAFESAINPLLGELSSFAVEKFRGQLRKGGDGRLELSFLHFEGFPTYRLTIDRLNDKNEVTHHSENPEDWDAPAPDFSLYRRWAHLAKLIPR